MGVDHDECDGCGEIFCSNAGSHQCENCGNTYCNNCANDTLVCWGEEGVFCEDCDKHTSVPDPPNKKLLPWIIEKYCGGKRKIELIEEYNKDNKIEGTPIVCECGATKNICDDIANNYFPLGDLHKNYYTQDYKKNKYGNNWNGSKKHKSEFDQNHDNLEGAQEPPYMRPKGCCCICTNGEVDLCEKCEKRKPVKKRMKKNEEEK